MPEQAGDENARPEDLPLNEQLSPRNSSFQDDTRTPPRIFSSHSLVGEELLASSRRPSINVELSPFTPSEETTPPSIQLEAKTKTPSFSGDVEVPLSGQSAASRHKARNDPAILTRPPRVPQQVASTALNNRKDPLHHRGHSHSDYSLLSALTDSSWESNSHSHRYKRLPLSYDGNERSSPGNLTTASSHKSTPANLLQPILSGETNPPVSIFTSPDPSPRRAKEAAQEKQSAPPSIQTMSAAINFCPSLKHPNAAPRIRTRSLDATHYVAPANQRKPSSKPRPSIAKLTSVKTSTPSQGTVPTRHILIDVMETVPRDDEDEACAIEILESSRIPKNLSRSIFPEIADDDRAHDFESELEQSYCARATENGQSFPKEIHANKEAIGELTEKLALRLLDSSLNSPHGKRGKHRKTDMTCFSDFMASHRLADRHLSHRILKLSSFALAVTMLLALFRNSPTSRHEDGENSLAHPSTSWWLVIFGLSQPLVLEMARVLELFVIDYLILQTSWLPMVIGSTSALHFALSKGWPFQLGAWAIMDFVMLWGNTILHQHWLSWHKSTMPFRDEDCPSELMTNTDIYKRLLWCSITLSIAAGFKRFLIGKLLGKSVTVRYQKQMEALLEKLLLLSEVSGLVKEGKTSSSEVDVASKVAIADELLRPSEPDGVLSDSFDYSELQGSEEAQTNDANSRRFSKSAEAEIMRLLDEWEKTDRKYDSIEEVSIRTILEFRRALSFIMCDSAMAEVAGILSTRKQCIEQAQRVFESLIHKWGHGNDNVLNFEVLCLLARTTETSFSRAKVNGLIALFRPSRAGKLTKLEFIKSIDSVYKSVRFLLGSIYSTSLIHEAFASNVDRMLSALAFLAIGAIMGVDTLLLVSIGAVLMAFFFALGTTGSTMFEGAFLLFVRAPYEVGDRLLINSSTLAMENSGSMGWIVEKVDFYATTLRSGSTREVAIASNGQVANARITNMNRSSKPLIRSHLKFGADTSIDQLVLFRDRVFDYVKARPREWYRIRSFRCTGIDSDSGCVEYVMVLQHRQVLQNVTAIKESKRDLLSYCMEVQKGLGIGPTAQQARMDLNRRQLDHQL